jgi:palmitoyl transferase
MKNGALKNLLALCTVMVSLQAASANCDFSSQWMTSFCTRISNITTYGTWDMYLTGYGWHVDGYSESEINSNSWGGGAGKHFTDHNGNEDNLFLVVFLDSHKHLEPLGGYARQWFTDPVLGGLSLGGGFFAGFTAREDIAHYVPVPLVLPIGSLRYQKASIMATFIPRVPGVSKGDVAFFWARYQF